jgi:GH18 family chitinase
MNRKFFLSLLIVASSLAHAAAPKIVGYIPYWAQYSQFTASQVRYGLVTQIHYAFIVPDENGAVAIADESDALNLVALADSCNAKNVQLVLSLGGSDVDAAFASNGSTPEKAEVLARNMLAFVREKKASGVELNWDVSTQEQAAAFGKIVQALVTVFKATDPSLIVSAAVYGHENFLSNYSSDILNQLDYITVTAISEMDETKSAVQPLCNGKHIESFMKELASNGVAKEKLVAVLPFTGRSFAKATGLGSSFEGVGSGNDGYLTYLELMKAFDGTDYKVTYDEASQSEVAVSSLETVVFTGIPSTKAVAEMVKSNGFGGVAAFDLSNDAPQPIVSLMVTIGKVLRPETNYKKVK